MTNEVLELGYEAARAALREQDQTLTNLRNRTAPLLAAAVVGTTLSTSLGLVNADPTKGAVLPIWGSWTLVVLVLVLGSAVMGVLWPIRHWQYGPHPLRFVNESATGIDEVLVTATRAMAEASDLNARLLRTKGALYRLSVAALWAELVVFLVSLSLIGV